MGPSAGSYLYALTVRGVSVDFVGLTPVSASTASAPAGPELVPAGDLVFVVSPFEGGEIRPERRNLAAHQGVLKRLMDAEVAFLPVSFGVVAPSNDDLAKLVRPNHDELLLEITRLAGKVEMGVKVSWDVPNIFQFFVFRNPDLGEMRDRVMSKPAGPSQEEKIALGKAFEAILLQTRERHSATVMGVLGPCVQEFKLDPPKDEKQVMNLSCLVDRTSRADFEKAVFEAAGLFDNNYAFDYNGPFPPYHFVRLSLGSP
jgi:hypothetical protein